ncbi:hypothetical protein [Patulibacter defluvii]|uniref:hypothetical protein n=1 Tax=Patulibacter defluvii TaxID=3095358 RepID=UPI002A748236|nr:hypothetical protein [Patulibacter sp. DM4]
MPDAVDPSPDPADAQRRLAEYERGFRRAGLPLMIEDYSADSDVFNRAFPLLALVFVGELLGALDLKWSLAANLAAIAGAVGLTLAAVALVNRLRQRPALAIPEDLGPVELAAFVLLPPLLPLIFNGQTTSALVTVLVNLGLLAIIALTFGFGVGSILLWATGHLLGQLALSLSLLARAIPLLLLFAIVLFINTEMWQVFGHMPDASLIAVGLLIAIVASTFLGARIPREVALLEETVRESGIARSAPPLRRAQRANVGMVLLISHGLQVLVVTLAVTGFFVAFGMLVIDRETQEAWTSSGGAQIVAAEVAGVRLRLTEELLRVAVAIGLVSGLYYAISVLMDSGYREEFLDELTGRMRQTFAARADYLELRAATGSGSGSSTGGDGSA